MAYYTTIINIMGVRLLKGTNGKMYVKIRKGKVKALSEIKARL